MTQHITPTAEEKAAIEELMKAPYPVTVGSIAGKLGCSDLEAAQKMPTEIVSFVTGDIAERFSDIWAELASWEKVTFFVIHASNVFEIQTKLSTGKISQGYYNILHKDAVIAGHLKYDSIGAVAFMRMPFMGRESLSVQFFAKDGSTAYSVYAGRENHQIIPSVKDGFDKACALFTGAQ